MLLSTDATSTGLNLQAANVLINLDLPWNPAVLEQRIGRIHRIGQTRGVQVINLISVGTIEEDMLSKLRFKTALFEGVLDGGDDAVFLSDDKFEGLLPVLEKYIIEEEEAVPQQASQEEPVQQELAFAETATAVAKASTSAAFLRSLAALLVEEAPVRERMASLLAQMADQISGNDKEPQP